MLKLQDNPQKLMSSLDEFLALLYGDRTLKIQLKQCGARRESIVSKIYFKKKVFWTGSYFVSSCGGVTIDVLKKYVRSSRFSVNSTLTRRAIPHSLVRVLRSKR